MPSVVDVYIETGSRRTFACAVDWAGWCRSAKDEHSALDNLLAYQTRYSRVAHRAGLRMPSGPVSTNVIERVKGGATTDFGAPEKWIDLDVRAMSKKERSKNVALLHAAWETFDETCSKSPPTLRKGPRGGGRDRDAMADHVVSAEAAYARKLGLRVKASQYADQLHVRELREAIADAIEGASQGGPPVERGWPPRYAVRRIVWHVLDHVWEMEDRSTA